MDKPNPTTEELIVFNDEIQLLRWSESHNNGATITFQLSDPSALDPFRRMTVKKGKIAGQRLMCVLVEIAEDETPVVQEVQPPKLEKPKGGELARLAAIWCAQASFWEWASHHFGLHVTTEAQAKEIVLTTCAITSRSELDHDFTAAEAFHANIRKPYAEFLSQRNAA